MAIELRSWLNESGHAETFSRLVAKYSTVEELAAASAADIGAAIGDAMRGTAISQLARRAVAATSSAILDNAASEAEAAKRRAENRARRREAEPDSTVNLGPQSPQGSANGPSPIAVNSPPSTGRSPISLAKVSVETAAPPVGVSLLKPGSLTGAALKTGVNLAKPSSASGAALAATAPATSAARAHFSERPSQNYDIGSGSAHPDRVAPDAPQGTATSERKKPNMAAILLGTALVAVLAIGIVMLNRKPVEQKMPDATPSPQAVVAPAPIGDPAATGSQPSASVNSTGISNGGGRPAPPTELPPEHKNKPTQLVAGHSSFVPGQPGDVPTPPVGTEFAVASVSDLPSARSASWPPNDVALAQLGELSDIRGRMASAHAWNLESLGNKQPSDIIQILGTNFQHMPYDERSYMQLWAQVAEDSPATGHVVWFAEGKFLGVVVRAPAAADISGRLQAEFGRGPDVEDPVQTETGRVTRRIWLQGNDVYSLRFGKPNETLLVARRSVYTRWRMLERQVENADHLFAEADKAANEIPPKLDEAEAGFKKCLELVPYYTRALGRLGKLAYWRGKYEDATRILDEGLGLVRNRDIRGDMLYYRGVVHTWFGEIEQAKAAFREDEQLNKTAIQGPARLAALEGRWDKGVLKLAIQEFHCAPATQLPDRPAQVAKEFPLPQYELETRLQALVSAKEFTGHQRWVEKHCSGHR